MNVTVTLQPRDPAGLEAFAIAVATPGSPDYRDYISTDEFAQRFGAPADQIQAVQTSLRAHGLNPGAPSPNGLSIHRLIRWRTDGRDDVVCNAVGIYLLRKLHESVFEAQPRKAGVHFFH